MNWVDSLGMTLIVRVKWGKEAAAIQQIFLEIQDSTESPLLPFP
jgi:hypothetical protein